MEASSNSSGDNNEDDYYYSKDILVNPASYVCQINTTRQIRRRRHHYCNPGYQDCHIVGLNMIKQLLNDNQWKTRRITCLTVIRIISEKFNQESNMVCCPVEKNQVTDKKDETDLLDALRTNNYIGTLNDNQRIMISHLYSLLVDIQLALEKEEGVGRSDALGSIEKSIYRFITLYNISH